MALKATIFKASLQVSDGDRHYYGEHALTLARHPSETDELDVGQPDEKRLIRASGRADRVTVYTYGSKAEQWWKANAGRLERSKNLTVWRVPGAASESVARLAERAMQLQCMVQEGQVWFSGATQTVQVDVAALQSG